MKNKMKISILAILSVVVLYSCTKYPDLYDDERTKDLTITHYDNTADFSHYKTYSIVDTIGEVVYDEKGDSNKLVPSKHSSLIINEINSNMAKFGYTKVDTSANPDLFVTAHTLAVDVKNVGSYYPYYGWGGGYYWGYPGYGYSYPYYYTYTKSYGSLVMDILDAKNIDHGVKAIKVVWTGILLGATNSTTGNQNRITSGIDEAFTQSPYLKH